MEILLNCVNSDLFKKHYNIQLKNIYIQNEILNYTDIKHAGNEVKSTLIKKGFIDNNKVMLLNKKRAEFIRENLERYTDNYVKMLIPYINDMKIILKKKWLTLEHNIVCHVILTSITQKILQKLNINKYGGNAYLIEDCLDMPLLYSKVIPINNSMIVLFTKTILQKLNFNLDLCLSNNRMINMLQSSNKEGVILPKGSMELQLFQLNLVKSFRQKNDYVGSYKLKLPTISPDLLQTIRSQLKEVSIQSIIFYKMLLKNKDLRYKEFCKVFEEVSEHNYIQAEIYIHNHLIVKELISKKVVSNFSDIPTLTGLGSRIMTTYAIDG